MAYQQNKPQAADQLKNSQADILGNFIAIKTLVDVNHVTFDTPDQGKHKFVTFPEQGASPATAINEVALFSRLSPITGLAALCFQPENKLAGSTDFLEFTTFAGTSNGSQILPSGLLIKWGAAGFAGNGGVKIITYNATTPFGGGGPFQVILHPSNSNATDPNVWASFMTTTANDFQVYVTRRDDAGNINIQAPALYTIRYIAIGRV